jgi:hypothetical protein
MRLWFGKYRGTDISEVPESYLCWMIDAMERKSLRELARDELNRRAEQHQYRNLPQVNFDSITMEIIRAGYKALAQRYHPDHGGDLAKMQELNAAMERLRK